MLLVAAASFIYFLVCGAVALSLSALTVLLLLFLVRIRFSVSPGKSLIRRTARRASAVCLLFCFLGEKWRYKLLLFSVCASALSKNKRASPLSYSWWIERSARAHNFPLRTRPRVFCFVSVFFLLYFKAHFPRLFFPLHCCPCIRYYPNIPPPFPFILLPASKYYRYNVWYSYILRSFLFSL